MKKILLLLLVIIALSVTAFADVTCSESIVASAEGNNLILTAEGTTGSWGASILATASGGCKFPSGETTYQTVMLYEDGNSKTVTLTNVDENCQINGDYKFGTCNVVNFNSVSFGTACTDTTWTPSESTVCSGDSFTQTSNCNNERTATGTKDCSNTCTDSTWTPAPSTKCAGDSFTQVSNCGTTRDANGTKDCSSGTGAEFEFPEIPTGVWLAFGAFVLFLIFISVIK